MFGRHLIAHGKFEHVMTNLWQATVNVIRVMFTEQTNRYQVATVY